jgi:signal transduction histidine kinase/CheY-like chemotaxis protein/sensor domain CHASE-containing protein
MITGYQVVRHRIVEDYNKLQMILATQASRSIEQIFQQLTDDQLLLSSDSHIARWDQEGRHLLANFQRLQSRYIKAITRVDANGRIIYTYPERPDLTGTDITYQTHVKKLIRTHEMVLSDVFNAVQGYQAVAFHYPVFDHDQFAGSIAMLVSFDKLAETHLANIKLGDHGRALLLSKEGNVLFNPDPSNLNMKSINILEEVPRGTLRIPVLSIHRSSVSTLQAVFCPVHIIDTCWTVVVSTPERDVVEPMQDIARHWGILLFLLLVGMSLFMFFSIRALDVIRTEEKRKEKENILRINEQNILNFVANSPTPTAFNDPDNKFTLLNFAFTFATGYQEKDIPNLKEWFSKFLPDEKARLDAFALLEETMSGKTTRDVKPKTTTITCRDGEKKTFEYRYSRIGSRHILTLNDITEKLEIDKQKRRLEEQLARSRKMEALGLLAGGVAHDLNNILSGIVTYPELILLKMEETDPLRKQVKSIMAAGKRAAAVVQDLLTLARGVAYKKTSFSLVDLLESCKSECQTLIPAETLAVIDIQWSLNPASPPLYGPEHHLRKAMYNLILNAAEAVAETLDGTKDKRGMIHISSHPGTIERTREGFETIPPGFYSVIEVTDNGPGIKHENLDRIFEPFFSKKVLGRSGSGLGLMVVWNTIKEFNGFIDIHTSEKGTTFSLFLSASDTPPNLSLTPVVQSLVQGRNECVLIVDDNTDQREIALALFKQLGFKASAVDSGEAAIQLLKKQDFTFILLDMILEHGMDGDETFRLIHEFKPNQKAIIASGYSQTHQVKETLKLGATAFLKKPYSIQELSDAIHLTLGTTLHG